MTKRTKPTSASTLSRRRSKAPPGVAERNGVDEEELQGPAAANDVQSNMSPTTMTCKTSANRVLLVFQYRYII